MAIYKVHHYSNFTQISNEIIRNREISNGAFRAFAVLLSHSAGWEFSIKSYADEMGIIEKTASRYIHELMDAGYIEEINDRNEKGQFIHGYNFYETPQLKNDSTNTLEPEEKKPPVKKDPEPKPSVDKPRPQNASVACDGGFSLYNNKNRVTKKDSQKESEKSASPEKQKFGKYKNILLTPDEYKSLTERYGKDQTDRSIEVASEYGHMNGRRYSYARMDVWIRQDTEKAGIYGENNYEKPQSHKSHSDFDVSEYEIICVNNYNVVGYDPPTEEVKKREEEKKRK